MPLLARIHSSESFGTLDGPGIRYVLFFQGCQMKCIYCHNRDTWDALDGNLLSVDDLMPKILSYRNFMRYSGGGVTCSGGEPLLQLPFLIELFERLKKHGIHTCLDTNGSIKIYDDQLDRLMASTDLVMLDLKAIDNDVHMRLTGMSNCSALDFARYVSQHKKCVWIRFVVVPGFTDTDESAHLLGQFITEEMDGVVEKVDLLSYHDLGKYKWAAYEGEYHLNNACPPSKERLDSMESILKEYGLKVECSV